MNPVHTTGLKKGSSCSGLCGRVGGIDGVVMKVCSGCKVMSYCSVECQRAAWPKHKEYCKKTVEKSLKSFVGRMLEEDHPLRLWIHMCLVREFAITKDNMCATARKPLYAQLNVGVEPVDIAQLFQLVGNKDPNAFDHAGVSGMIQIHNIAELARLPSYTNYATEQAITLWKETRTRMDQRGFGHHPVIILRTIDGFEEYHFMHTVPIFMPAVEEAWKPRFMRQVAPAVIRNNYNPEPHDAHVPSMISNMNEMIRADKKNKLRMRTPFRACDKRLLLDACYAHGELDYTQIILRAKLYREPVYHDYALSRPPQAIDTPLEYDLLDFHDTAAWRAEKERRKDWPCPLCEDCGSSSKK